MKKTILFPAIVFLFLLMHGCIQQSPEAKFSIEGTTHETDNLIQFNNESLNASNFEWDFGDGVKSTEWSPTHEYRYAGDYEVSLRAIKNDRESEASANIEIVPGYTPTIIEGESVDEIIIYDEWRYIKNLYGTEDTIYYLDYLPDYELYYHTVFYRSRGLAGVFISNDSVLIDEDLMYIAYIFVANGGITYKGISFENTIGDVYDAYGTPLDVKEYTDATGYWFDDLGVDFYEFEESDSVDEIDIYEPTILDKSANIKRIATKEFMRNYDRTRFKK